MRARIAGLVLSLAGLLIGTTTPAVAAGAPQVTRVSVSTTGAEANGGSGYPYLSADGRSLAFSSYATNFVPGCSSLPGREGAAYVRDLTAGTTQCVDRAIAQPPTEGATMAEGISADGRYVLYTVVTGAAGGDIDTDAYVLDRVTGVRHQVNIDVDGQPVPLVWSAALSGDGHVVAFADAAEGASDDSVVVRNWVSGTSTRIPHSWYSQLCVSGDGRYVMYFQLVGSSTIWLMRYDTATATKRFVAAKRVDDTTRFSCSVDGSKVLFDDSRSAVPSDTNAHEDVYLATIGANLSYSLQRVSVAADGRQGNGDSFSGAISPDGRYAAFTSWATNLAPGKNAPAALYIRNLASGQVVAVRPPGGDLEYGGSNWWPRASVTTTTDRVLVAFGSQVSNLVPGDGNDTSDIFLATLSAF